MIKVEGLRKSFQGQAVLNGIDLDVPENLGVRLAGSRRCDARRRDGHGDDGHSRQKNLLHFENPFSAETPRKRAAQLQPS